MKTSSFLAIVSAFMPLLAYASPTVKRNDGLQCTTLWKGDLNLIKRSSSESISVITLNKFDEQSLVIDEASATNTQSFTFSECSVQGWDRGGKGTFGVIQPSDDVVYNPTYGCVTARDDDVHRLVIDTCATDGGDTKLTFQWFQVNTNGIGRDDYAIAELVGGPAVDYYFPNAAQVWFESEKAVAVSREHTDQVLAFHNVEWVVQSTK